MEDVTLAHAKEHLEELVERAANGEVVHIVVPKIGRVRLQADVPAPSPRITDTMAPFVPLDEPRVPGRLQGIMHVPARLMEPMSEDELCDWYGDDA